MEINRNNINDLTTSWRIIFNGALDSSDSTRDKVAMTVLSTTRANAYPWLGRLPGMREWIGSRVINNLKRHGFLIENQKFENTVGVKRDDVDDDEIGIYRPMFEMLGISAAELPERLVWDALKNGFTEICYDGQPFFDTDHIVLDKNGDETSVSNHMGGAGDPWFLLDVSKPIKPLIFQDRRKPSLVAKTQITDENVFDLDEYVYGVDMRCAAGYGLWQLAMASKQVLNEANFAAARQAMMGMLGDQGEPLRLKPGLLVVPPSLEEVALKLLQAENNAAGATNVYRNAAQLHVEPLLSA